MAISLEKIPEIRSKNMWGFSDCEVWVEKLAKYLAESCPFIKLEN
jgi:hypothetical protein